MFLIQFFIQGGPLMYPLVLIALVLFGIILRTEWHLIVRGGSDAAAIENCLDGLLFWGGFAVIIGVLGSVIGYHKALTAVIAHGVVNPRAVWIGSAEGLVTSIAGLFMLAVAGTLWFTLRWQFIRNR